MATLTVWRFDSPGGAPSMAARLDTLAHEGAITIVDGAIVEWAESAGKPRTTQLRHRGRRGALVGGGLGALVGTILLAPVAGAAIGAAAGGASASAPRPRYRRRTSSPTCGRRSFPARPRCSC